MNILGRGIGGKLGKFGLPRLVIGLSPKLPMTRIFFWCVKIACHSRCGNAANKPVAITPIEKPAIIALDIAGKIQRHYTLSLARSPRFIRLLFVTGFAFAIMASLKPISRRKQKLCDIYLAIAGDQDGASR
jgi:hypothetical protein